MATKLSPVGPQFTVNQTVTFDQSSPDIASLSDGRFVVVLSNDVNSSGTDIDIRAQFINANGTLAGSTFVISNEIGPEDNPAVAARNDGGFTVVWQDKTTADPDIYYTVVNSAGTRTVNHALLMNSPFTLQNPDIATMFDLRQIVVAERVVDSNTHDIGFDVVDGDGTTQLFSTNSGGRFGTADTLTGALLTNPAVAGGPNRALVVYRDNSGETDPSQFHISGSLFNETSNTFGPRLLIADGPAGHSMGAPDVAYIGSDRFVITYQVDDRGIGARIYNSDTGDLSPQITVNTQSAELMGSAKVAATADGGFVVTWTDLRGDAPDTTGESIHTHRFDPYGNPFGDEFVVNTLTDSSQENSVVSIAGSNVVMAWTDFASRPGDTDPTSIQAQRFNAPGFDFDSAALGDFNNNGRSDLLFQNLATGEVAIWTTNAAGLASSIIPQRSLPAGFTIDGTGNFNSTPGDDILLRSSSGQVAVWVTSGTSVVDFKVLGSAPSAYVNAGIGDFTGDGQSDLVFRHTGTGEIASWQVVNNALGAPPKVLGSAPNVYQIAAVADFTGDHQADILFRNTGTGEIAEWRVANNQLLSAQVVGSTSSAYHVVGTGDFDGNGANDILFRHDNGELVMWLLNNAGQLLSAPQSVATVSDIFHVDGTGDLNGDGRDDIIFRDPNGAVIEWLMNGTAATAIQTVGTASQDFAISAHHFDLI